MTVRTPVVKTIYIPKEDTKALPVPDGERWITPLAVPHKEPIKVPVEAVK